MLILLLLRKHLVKHSIQPNKQKSNEAAIPDKPGMVMCFEHWGKKED